MSRLFYHEHPETLTLATNVVDAQPGRIVLADSPFFAGGGGQLPDKGVIRWNGGEIAVTGFEPQGGRTWILLGQNVELSGAVEASVDSDFRQMMRELHTDTHLLNAFVYQQFNGALVTGGADEQRRHRADGLRFARRRQREAARARRRHQ
jgi:misacylated tRNA(Ala) deacylase